MAATVGTTLVAMGLLRDLKVIEVPWPHERWALQPDAEETPLEGLQWRYCWTTHTRDQLLPALEDYLESVPFDEYGLSIRLQFWKELAMSEVEGYLEFRLAKHRFAKAWARDLMFLHPKSTLLSVAQWRYCVWAATRHGGSVAQQQAVGEPSAVREAIYSELRRRMVSVLGGWRECAFLPTQLAPSNSLSRAFVSHLCPRGFDFWGTPPTLSGLHAN